MAREPENKADRYQEFLRLLALEQKRIFGLIRSLVPQRPVAEDILQETLLVMWEQFESFTPGTDFRAWGMRIARFQVLRYSEKRSRDRLCFDTEVLNAIAAAAEPAGSREDRVEALKLCLAKLGQRDRSILELRYRHGRKTAEISELLGRPAHQLYRHFSRLHELLYMCVRRALAQG